ncbi:GntR family transcriptional regulator [Nocardiopsis coralliicola]
MILSIDLDSEVPIYQQLRDRVVEAVASGELREGSRLPPTRTLGADLGVNFHTVNKAYDQLRREGLLRINRKTGAVIQRDPASGPPPPEFAAEWEERLATLLAEATAQGLTGGDVADACTRRLAAFRGAGSAEERT